MAKQRAREGADPPRSVGYGNPPVDHRIQKGEVRNPHGRRGKPKPPVDFLDEMVTLTVSGRQRQLTRREAIDHFLFNKAARGDVRAIAMLETRESQRRHKHPQAIELPPEEQAAFDRYVRRHARKLPPEAGS